MDAALLRRTGNPKRVNQTCTEVVLQGVRATDLELGDALTHGGQNPSGKIPVTDSELGHAVTHGGKIRVGQNPGGKDQATDSKLGHAVTHGGQNPGGAKSGGQKPGNGSGTRSRTHMPLKQEDPETQALFGSVFFLGESRGGDFFNTWVHSPSTVEVCRLVCRSPTAAVQTTTDVLKREHSPVPDRIPTIESEIAG